jgi:hypothetical protein
MGDRLRWHHAAGMQQPTNANVTHVRDTCDSASVGVAQPLPAATVTATVTLSAGGWLARRPSVWH